MDTENLVAIGRILKPRGFIGEVKVMPMTDFPDRFKKLEYAWIEIPEGKPKRFRVENVKMLDRFLAIKFEGIDSLPQAELLREGFICIEKKELYPLPEGSYYVFDVIGMEVETVDGRKLGVVSDIINLPAHDIYVVNGPDGKIQIPAVRAMIQQVDMASRKMLVDLPEGLTEL